MNLLEAPWIPVRRKHGTTEWIAPWQITDGINGDDPIVAVDAPRPDFTGALMQFLIGLLQTASAPKNIGVWSKHFREPPPPDILKEEFNVFREAFEFGADRPSFMEDYELDEKADKPISGLLIEAPGSNTIKENKDLFVKRGYAERLCPEVAAMALLTLQINAPSGGVGHRTSLRGGGPLTTLVLNTPHGEYDRLWNNLWLNVLDKSEFERLSGNARLTEAGAFFPWLAPCRRSDKHGGPTTPRDAHPLTAFWATPRRVRLDWVDVTKGSCDISGKRSDGLIQRYATKNYGANYEGAWLHPLSPYRENNDSAPLPRHPQPGGIHYRHWLGLTTNVPGKDFPAAVIDSWNSERAYVRELKSESLHLWSFGYDMDNMKARCWYESLMPLIHVNPQHRQRFGDCVEKMIDAAEQIGGYLSSALKQAWFKRPKDATGDMSFITDAFWQATETAFFSQLDALASTLSLSDSEQAITAVNVSWLHEMRGAALKLFDRWATGGHFESEDPRRIADAQNNLVKKLYGPKLKQGLGVREVEHTIGQRSPDHATS